LDEHRQQCKTLSSLFEDISSVSLRSNLIAIAQSIILEDFESIGRKTRDILWRKAYYDVISTAKKFWKKLEGNLNENEREMLRNFINDGIRTYKTLILKLEDMFNLDIRYIIDFSIIANGACAFEKKSEREIYTVNETKHALTMIHSFLVAIGDLHRYSIEFKLSDVQTSSLAASYYNEAFKLDPTIGSPQNQLGTLKSAKNFEIDSIFHYLYALSCTSANELSEANVSRIFQHNHEALELKSAAACEGFSMQIFMMQVTLLIDIFFYDKPIDDLNSICFGVLMNFKEYLKKFERNKLSDVTFQMTSCFILCLMKLKSNDSPKVANMNAFLIAFCDIIMECVNTRAEDYIFEHKNENVDFCDAYALSYQEFERKIRRARDIVRKRGSIHNRETLKDSGIDKNGSSNSQKEVLSGDSKFSSQKSQPGDVKIMKRPTPTSNRHNIRRRRKCRASESEESETESFVSDNEDDESESDAESINSDFDSYDEEEDYVNMRFSSEEDDGDDFVIESEEVVFKDDNALSNKHISMENNGPLKFQENNNISNSSNEDVVIEEESLVFSENVCATLDEMRKLLRMRHKRKYVKVDPNIVINFNEKYASWMQSLKLLFDWLCLSNEVLLDCYRSNPEFLKKIMNLVNFLNIDIFTRNIYFERSLITVKNVRENLRHLFDIRHQVATSEDVIFKKFKLFEEVQQPIDWSLNYKLQLTKQEDAIMRLFKLIDIGFTLCKTKKFNYSFCARSRVFVEKQSQSRRGKRGRRGGRNRSGRYSDDKKRSSRRRNRRGGRRSKKSSECEKVSIKTHSQDSQENRENVEEFPSLEQSKLQDGNRKGYIKSKETEAMMGKLGRLWLQNELQTLESKSKPAHKHYTPYLMLDTIALIDYLNIVKNLVKCAKFVVLIPKAVLQDLDGLKKSKDGARTAIKWLEMEFQRGNRGIRAQRDAEVLPLPLIKFSKKMGMFSQIMK
jgi:protein SMG5